MCEGERNSTLETKRFCQIMCPRCLRPMKFIGNMLSNKVHCLNIECSLHEKVYLIQEQKIKLLAIEQ